MPLVSQVSLAIVMPISSGAGEPAACHSAKVSLWLGIPFWKSSTSGSSSTKISGEPSNWMKSDPLMRPALRGAGNPAVCHCSKVSGSHSHVLWSLPKNVTP